MSSFAQLLEQSKSLTTHIVSNLPPIQRSLPQIEAQTRKLLSQTRPDVTGATTPYGPQGTGLDTRAAYLLANKGFDADALQSTLSKVDVSKTFEGDFQKRLSPYFSFF